MLRLGAVVAAAAVLVACSPSDGASESPSSAAAPTSADTPLDQAVLGDVAGIGGESSKLELVGALYEEVTDTLPAASRQAEEARQGLAAQLMEYAAQLRRDLDEAEAGGVDARLPAAGGGKAGSSLAVVLVPRAQDSSADAASFFGAWVGLLARWATELTPGKHDDPFTSGNGKQGMKVDLYQDEAGNIVVEQGFTNGSEGSATVDGKKTTVSSEAGLTFKVKGNPCPNESGEVTFDIDVTRGQTASVGTSTFGGSDHLAGTLIGGVDDSAKLASADLQAQYDIKGINGGKPYLYSTAGGIRLDSDGGEGARASVSQPFKEVYNTQHVDYSAARERNVDLMGVAKSFSWYYLKMVEEIWRGGRCVEVVADSPGQVDPSSSHDIKVAVRHKLDGTSLSVPVDVTLSGGASVSPDRIEAAPGTVTYKASDKSPDSATISLVSTSRRGIGKKDLGITIGLPAFLAKGGGGDFKGSGTICSLVKPFTIQGGGVTVEFTPKDATAGSYSYTGSLQGFKVFGKGTYTVDATDKGGTLTATGPGTVKTPLGNMSATDSEHYTLTPTDPCE